MKLEDFGWTSFFENALAAAAMAGHRPGRVFLDIRGIYSLYTEAGEVEAELRGRFRHSGAERPVTGDWVLFRERLIEAVLPRRTRLSRRQAGARTAEQVLAANVDVVFLVAGLDANFNLRRLERGLVLVRESGARPVIVLNKADVCGDARGAALAAQSVAPGVPVIAASAVDGEGLAEISRAMRPGETAALIGSSGVGKSTLINALLGYQRQPVREVRADDSRGRHTTTRRELIRLPEGWLIMDLPGLRELQLWADEAAVEGTFAEIAALAEQCRFRDCRHQGEPGCAVADALQNETLEPARFQSYTKMRRELEHLEREQDALARLEQKRRWKRIHQSMKKMYKERW
jgi:ribosome biogenesis GTPase / thiamine phosphate phosphatase